MTNEDAEKYLRLLGQELQKQGITGEILVHDDISVFIDIRIPEIVDANAYLTNEGDALQCIKCREDKIMTTSSYRQHTIAETFEQICKKKAPWVALGDFLNDWQCYAVEQREELIKSPLFVPSHPVMVRWAAFCAAMVEWLCYQDNIQCPNWVKQECYVLPNPWFFYRKWDTRSWLLATTPAPFKMRNIFCGDRVILNKWNVAQVAEQ